jgi:hypothetical protein
MMKFQISLNRDLIFVDFYIIGMLSKAEISKNCNLFDSGVAAVTNAKNNDRRRRSGRCAGT